MGPLDHAAGIGGVLDALDIPWVIGGSLASSFLGEPRATNDLDLALVATVEQVPDVADRLASNYLVQLPMLLEAASGYGSANILHIPSGFKVDAFFLGDNRLDRWQIERRVRVAVGSRRLQLWMTSPIDVVLRKLWWYQLGGSVSDRQWNDVVAVLRVQATLDRAQLRANAAEVGLVDVVDRAVAAASAR